jgi:general secretion pathway protein L
LIPRSVIDPLLEEFSLAGWGLDKVILDERNDSKPLDLVPQKFRKQPNKEVTITKAVLSASIIVLLALVFFLPMLWWDSKSEELEVSIKAISKEVKEVAQIREDIEKLEKESNFLEQRKHRDPALIDTLEELSGVLPDNAWLNGLQFRDKRLVIQGQSISAAALIEKLEASDYFEHVNFISPVTKDPMTGTERFQIATDVINGRFSGKVTPKTNQTN